MSRRKAPPPQPTLPFADADPLRLADGQRKALDLRANHVISASAGTGKTRTLTALYVALLEGRLKPGEQFLDEHAWLARVQQGERGLHPSQIVAVTFTKKAAAELLHRAREAVMHERKRDDLPAALRDHLQQCWEELPAAPITTIDSFCARLLREAGARGPAPAGFTVLEPDEADELLERALLDVAAEWLEQKKDEHFTFLARQWGVVSRRGVVAVGSRLLSRLRTRGLAPKALLEGAAAALSPAQIRERIQAFRDAVTNAPRVPRSTPKQELLDWFGEALSFSTLHDLHRAVLQLRHVFYDSKGNRYAWAERNDVNEPSAELLHSLHGPFVDALAAYLDDAAVRHSQAKRRAGGVDFNDAAPTCR
ncbi:MAG: UvrD-helicase domain-containing protein [Planctomycetota bacterium]|nr:UvrD-helicase domain-containing protein [Planctomycetota bacterium]